MTIFEVLPPPELPGVCACPLHDGFVGCMFGTNKLIQRLRTGNEGERLAAVLAEPPRFDEAWARKEAEGYSYGQDALEQVRLGWEMAVAALGARSEPCYHCGGPTRPHADGMGMICCDACKKAWEAGKGGRRGG